MQQIHKAILCLSLNTPCDLKDFWKRKNCCSTACYFPNSLPNSSELHSLGMVRTVQTQPSQRWLHIIILNVQVKWLRPCFDKLYLGLQVGFGKYVPQWVVLTEIQTDQKNASILALPLLLIVNKI